MRKIAAIFLLGAFMITSCGTPDDDGQAAQVKVGKGGVVYGGVFRVNEVEDFRNLFPLNVTEVTSHRITNQVYEGLVKFNQKDLNIENSLAESWEMNEEGTQFTFKLRKGVKFHADPCFPGEPREMTAKDVEYCFTQICAKSAENQMFWLFENRVVGANEYFQSTVDGAPLEEGVTGIKVIDDYTIQIDLEYPFAGFIKIIGHSGCWIYPREAFEKYGTEMRIKCVGTGAFVVKTVKEGEAVILERNADYWRKDEHGNQLPFLDAIKYTFLKEKKSELLEFRKGNLDMVFRLPLEMIDQVVGELHEAKSGGNAPFEMQVTSAYAVQYYGFQHKSELFKNRDLRMAFNLAIDREALVTYTLQGDGRSAEYGIVPPGLKGYNYDSLVGYQYNPKEAKRLLELAGFPNGEGFPVLSLQLNSGGSRNVQLAEAVQSMIKENLNIDIKMEVMPFAQHLENLETGKSLYWRTGWVADYPDPENFLNLLYGPHVPENLNDKSYVNSVRYQSDEFDAAFKEAIQTVDKLERFEKLRKADQIQINDAAIMPIYYDEFTRLLQPNVKNFPANAMENRDFGEVYFKDHE